MNPTEHPNVIFTTKFLKPLQQKKRKKNRQGTAHNTNFQPKSSNTNKSLITCCSLKLPPHCEGSYMLYLPPTPYQDQQLGQLDQNRYNSWGTRLQPDNLLTKQ